VAGTRFEEVRPPEAVVDYHSDLLSANTPRSMAGYVPYEWAVVLWRGMWSYFELGLLPRLFRSEQ